MIDETTGAYLEAALWTSELDDLTIYDFPESDLIKATEVANQFLRENLDDLHAVHMDPAQIGHDIWLTRNGYGAGFWDRGLGEIGERLSESARKLGPCECEKGDDGLPHLL